MQFSLLLSRTLRAASTGTSGRDCAMSHFATNWAIRQRGLKPTTKIVLWHLSDRHNPDYGCFPAQDRLAHDCEISRAALNSHLALLEARGLLRRERRIDPGSRRQMSTRYILAFEDDFGLGQEGSAGAGPCPDSGHGPESGFSTGPCPENRQSRVQNLDTNLVREPLREPVKEEEEEGAQARDAVSEGFFGALLNALGLAPGQELSVWWQGWPPREHVRRWRDELGLSEDRIIEAAKVSRNAHPKPPDGPKALDRVMERAAQLDALAAAQSGGQKPGRARRRDDAPRPGPDELAAFYADLVNSDRFLPANTISNTMRDAMLARGLVTPERLRQRGVR